MSPYTYLSYKEVHFLVAKQKKYHHVARHKINNLTCPDETLTDEKNRVDFSHLLTPQSCAAIVLSFLQVIETVKILMLVKESSLF